MKPALQGLRIHVEGMGLTGSLLAHQLERLGAEWTWSDNDAPMNAWRACTGAIYPAGKEGSLDDLCYKVWDRWLAEKTYAMPRQNHFEQAVYWFSTKSPPHDGRYAIEEVTRHGLSRASLPSYHLNAQTFVPATRALFKTRRQARANEHVYVVAHGFGARLHHVVWGWTVPVTLRYPMSYAPGARPSFYFRKGRFQMAYAYRIPNSGMWYAGSSLIVQRVPKELEVEPKYERWKELFEELSGGAVKVTGRGDVRQGWRPAEGGAHVDPVVQRRARRYIGRSVPELSVPPLWHSGIRHFPRVWQQLQAELLKVKEER